MPALPVNPSAVVVLIVGGIFLWRRADVRLVLVASAAALFFVHSTQHDVIGHRFESFCGLFVELARRMIDPNFVIPICSAMGFAYVCKLTACDAHLVHLLIRPLYHVKWLLIPGGIAVAWLVNSAIVSQTSTVSVVGPVLIPLLMAAGISRVTAGALLLLGGSMGGELMNPAAVEVTAIKGVTHIEATTIIARMLPYNLLASGVALVVFSLMAIPFERRQRMLALAGGEKESWGVGGEETIDTAAAEPGSMAATMSKPPTEPIGRVNLLKAAVPIVPIFLLLVVKLAVTHYEWARRLVPLPAVLTDVNVNPIAEQTSIATAMLIGVMCAAFTSPSCAGKLPAAFFEGAGFAYAHVISVIICAYMFVAGLTANGLIDTMAKLLQNAPAALTVGGVVLPWILACVTGTAVGTAPIVIRILVPLAMGSATGDAALAAGLRIGSVNAITAQFGRTSSPVAPVAIMCATLSRTRPIDLVKRVAPPLIAGGLVLLLAALWAGR